MLSGCCLTLHTKLSELQYEEGLATKHDDFSWEYTKGKLSKTDRNRIAFLVEKFRHVP